jgi:DNA polymerase III sliding clamp (beta) subunit (PCNA family)
MLTSLRFCAGSVAKKDLVNALTHFLIANSKVRGFNGILALCSPIPFNISCKPKAETLIKAIANCEDTVMLTLTPAGRLSVKSGVFKAYIDCIQEDTMMVEPEGVVINFDGNALLKGIKAVAPFIGEDASRPWANGVLVKDKSLFATNNVMLVQYWLGVEFPHIVNIPKGAIKEMLRIGEPPTHAQVAENSITFHYEGDRWLRTQLYITEWPDLGKVLNVASNQGPLDERLFDALEVVKPFVDKQGSIFISAGKITTHPDENEGASYDVPDLQDEGKFNIEMLNLLKGVKTIDWSTYPRPCMFQSDSLRGAIIGMRK